VQSPIRRRQLASMISHPMLRYDAVISTSLLSPRAFSPFSIQPSDPKVCWPFSIQLPISEYARLSQFSIVLEDSLKSPVSPLSLACSESLASELVLALQC
jgi:hypothetical protein